MVVSSQTVLETASDLNLERPTIQRHFKYTSDIGPANVVRACIGEYLF